MLQVPAVLPVAWMLPELKFVACAVVALKFVNPVALPPVITALAVFKLVANNAPVTLAALVFNVAAVRVPNDPVVTVALVNALI